MDGDFFIYAVNDKLDEMIRQAHGGVGLRPYCKIKIRSYSSSSARIDEQRRIVTRIKEMHGAGGGDWGITDGSS